MKNSKLDKQLLNTVINAKSMETLELYRLHQNVVDAQNRLIKVMKYTKHNSVEIQKYLKVNYDCWDKQLIALGTHIGAVVVLQADLCKKMINLKKESNNEIKH